jgi:hypothetical protein
MEIRAQETRRPRRERVLREEPEHPGLALEQPGEEAREPGALLAAREGGEPHLPVEPREVERCEARRAPERTGLVAEHVGPPGPPVVAPEQLDLVALGRHHGEEPVGARHVEGCEPVLERREGGRAGQRDAEAIEHREEREGEEPARRRAEGGAPRARPRARRRRDRGRGGRAQPGGEQARQRPVVEERRAEDDGQRVEEAVVPGPGDQALESDQPGAGDEPRAAPGEDPERQHDLDGERRERRPAQAGRRELVGDPARPGRDRLRLEVMGERREVAPGGVAREELHRARHEEELRDQAARQPDRERVRGAPRRAEGAQTPRRHERREQARLEQQHVPLVGEEDPAGGDHREVERGEPCEREARRDPRPGRDRERHAAGAERVQRAVARTEPEQGRALEPGAGPAPCAQAGERLRRRCDPAAAEQSVDLDPQRREGGELDRGEPGDEGADDEPQPRVALGLGLGSSLGQEAHTPVPPRPQ